MPVLERLRATASAMLSASNEPCSYVHLAEVLTLHSKVFELAAGVQSYDWGAVGKDSVVAQYANGLPDFKIESDKPYAELWMGTHPSKPSHLLEDGRSLADVLRADASLIGPAVREKFGDDLPFLFKVLAVGKALSIQAHPDKKLGAKLHKDRPDVYKDDPSDAVQPEMAIALTPFSGFCGFKPLDQVADDVENVPEFAAVVGEAGSSFVKAVRSADKSALASSAKERPAALADALKAIFSALMNADSDAVIKPRVRELVDRIKREKGVSKSSELKAGSVEELVVRLDEQFPDDVGIFCAFLLNVVVLEPGQAAFLQANEPHAYLQGDIIECMATSDNVVRAGLTPKLRDVPTLTSMLTYTWAGPDAQKMRADKFRSCEHTKLYDPPIAEFSVALVDTTSSGAETHPPIDGPSILIVTALEGGKAVVGGLPVHRAGQVFFVGAGAELSFEGKLVAYRAYVTV